MFRHYLTASVMIGAVAASRADSTLWYGGDIDYMNGMPATHRDDRTSTLYEDFDIGPGGATVTQIFGHYAVLLFYEPVFAADYEIRSGVSAGNGGTLVFSGNSPVTWQYVQDYSHAAQLFRATVSGLDLYLPEGRYWLSISPNRDHELWLASTSGANGIGSPINNGNSFWTAPWYDAFFTPTKEVIGTDQRPLWDFSYGVVGTPVPEAGSLLPLSLLTAIMLKSRLNRRGRVAGATDGIALVR